MPQPDLPQYPLPNPQLPLGQQAVSPVAQTNPLNSLTSGLQGGFGLGLQQRQVQALENERQIQLMQAQSQQRIAQATILKEALAGAHENFKTIADINPDAAMDYYHTRIAPLQDEFWGQYGVRMDSSQIPASHNNADVLDQVNKATDLALSDPSKVPIAQNILSHLQNQMDIGKMAQEKIGGAQKAIGGFQEYNKHLDQLEKDWSDQINVTKARSGGFGLQDQKVDQAIHLRQMLNQYHDPKTDNFNVPTAQYKELVLGLASLLSPTGTAAEGTIKDLESMTAKGKLSKAVQYITGTPQTGNTQAIIRNLADSIDRQGLTSQQLRDQYIYQLQPPSDLPPDRAQRQINKGRGSAFVDYLPGGQYGPKTLQDTAHTPDVLSYAQRHNITPDQAMQVKLKRGKK